MRIIDQLSSHLSGCDDLSKPARRNLIKGAADELERAIIAEEEAVTSIRHKLLVEDWVATSGTTAVYTPGTDLAGNLYRGIIAAAPAEVKEVVPAFFGRLKAMQARARERQRLNANQTQPSPREPLDRLIRFLANRVGVPIPNGRFVRESGVLSDSQSQTIHFPPWYEEWNKFPESSIRLLEGKDTTARQLKDKGLTQASGILMRDIIPLLTRIRPGGGKRTLQDVSLWVDHEDWLQRLVHELTIRYAERLAKSRIKYGCFDATFGGAAKDAVDPAIAEEAERLNLESVLASCTFEPIDHRSGTIDGAATVQVRITWSIGSDGVTINSIRTYNATPTSAGPG